jgi:TetR/AcrR family transcriptional regulator, copper-responsive repressor
MDCYWREGVQEVSMNEVCRRAGISKPGLYREFGGEDGLMEAALVHYRTITTVPTLGLLASERPFAQVLEDLLDGLTQAGDMPAGCLLTMMRAAPGRLGPATRARVQAVTEELRQAYQAWFTRGRSRGEVDPTVSPTLAAHLIDTQISTVLLQMGLGQDPGLVRAQAQLALKSLLRGSASGDASHASVSAPAARGRRPRAARQE